jgi:hypothetical protein
MFVLLLTSLCMWFGNQVDDANLYNPAHYEHLKVSGEVKDLFSFITQYVAYGCVLCILGSVT